MQSVKLERSVWPARKNNSETEKWENTRVRDRNTSTQDEVASVWFEYTFICSCNNKHIRILHNVSIHIVIFTWSLSHTKTHTHPYTNAFIHNIYIYIPVIYSHNNHHGGRPVWFGKCAEVLHRKTWLLSLWAKKGKPIGFCTSLILACWKEAGRVSTYLWQWTFGNWSQTWGKSMWKLHCICLMRWEDKQNHGICQNRATSPWRLNTSFSNSLQSKVCHGITGTKPRIA